MLSTNSELESETQQNMMLDNSDESEKSSVEDDQSEEGKLNRQLIL